MKVDVPAKAAADAKAAPACPCCGGTSFGPGPGGRLSRRGVAPRCLRCGSLERHRAGRDLLEKIRDRARFKEAAMLRFADEPLAAGGWFASVETSVFGMPGALDPEAIARPDGAFGCIICYHVITRVADHRKALHELVRVLAPTGLLLLSYPSPATRAETSDWGFADAKQHGSFRILGRDFENEIVDCVRQAHVMAVKVIDPVTGDDDLVYLVTKDFFWVRRVLAGDIDVRLID